MKAQPLFFFQNGAGYLANQRHPKLEDLGAPIHLLAVKEFQGTNYEHDDLLLWLRDEGVPAETIVIFDGTNEVHQVKELRKIAGIRKLWNDDDFYKFYGE